MAEKNKYFKKVAEQSVSGFFNRASWNNKLSPFMTDKYRREVESQNKKDAIVEKRTRAQIKILRYNLEQELHAVASGINEIKSTYDVIQNQTKTKDDVIADVAKLDILAERQRKLVADLDKITVRTGQYQTLTMKISDTEVYKELKKQNTELYNTLSSQGKEEEMLPNELYAQKLIAGGLADKDGKVILSEKRKKAIKEYGGTESEIEKAKDRKVFVTNKVWKNGANSDVIGDVRIYKNSATFNDSINNIRKNIHEVASKQNLFGTRNVYEELGGYVNNDGKRNVEIKPNSDFAKKMVELKANPIVDVEGQKLHGHINQVDGIKSGLLKSNDFKDIPNVKTELDKGKDSQGKLGLLSSKELNEDNVAEQLKPAAEKIFKTNPDLTSVTIVSYKFNPATGQLDPATPTAGATFSKSSDKVEGRPMKNTDLNTNPVDTTKLNTAVRDAQIKHLTDTFMGKNNIEESKRDGVREQITKLFPKEGGTLDQAQYQDAKKVTEEAKGIDGLKAVVETHNAAKGEVAVAAKVPNSSKEQLSNSTQDIDSNSGLVAPSALKRRSSMTSVNSTNNTTSSKGSNSSSFSSFKNMSTTEGEIENKDELTKKFIKKIVTALKEDPDLMKSIQLASQESAGRNNEATSAAATPDSKTVAKVFKQVSLGTSGGNNSTGNFRPQTPNISAGGGIN